MVCNRLVIFTVASISTAPHEARLEEEVLDKECHFEVEEILVYLRERADTEDEEIRVMIQEVQDLIIARKKPMGKNSYSLVHSCCDAHYINCNSS